MDGNSSADGTNIQLYSYNSTYGQMFNINRCGEVLNLGDDLKALILNTKVWKPIMQNEKGDVVLGTETRKDMPRMLWHLIRHPGLGSYTIYSYLDGRWLDVDCSGTENGTKIKCYKQNGTLAQQWYIMRREDGSIYLSHAGLRW